LKKINPYTKVRYWNFNFSRKILMATATLTSKGQVTIPSAVRAALGLDTGSRIEFVETGKGQFAIVAATSSVQALKGILRKPAKPVSLSDMERAIASQGMRG
jgi:AbrB family looped-hinge helix DNA binding protein